MALEFACRHRYPSGFELDVSFASEHRVTTLFGPSGSGKTTILSVISGALRPREGEFRLQGRQLLSTRQGVDVPIRQRRIGMVFQEQLLFPHLTVEANLLFGRRGPRPAITLHDVVEALELHGMLERRPAQLSGGQRQRVALGRALLAEPDLLVMDEPLGALDDPLKFRILVYLERTLARWKIPTLFVTHSQAEVRRISDWVIVLDRGKIVAQGTPDEALGRPEALAMDGQSSGPANLLRIDELVHEGDHRLGRLGQQTLRLPPMAEAPRLPLLVQCSPRDVVLATHEVSGLSTRNRLHGVVRQVVPAARAVFVAVDVGQMLWAEITPEAAEELRLAPGASVVCLIKTHSLEVLA